MITLLVGNEIVHLLTCSHNCHDVVRFTIVLQPDRMIAVWMQEFLAVSMQMFVTLHMCKFTQSSGRVVDVQSQLKLERHLLIKL